MRFENTLPTTNGEKIAIAVSYVPDIGRDQIVRGFFALVTDITERKREERSLEGARDELQLLVDARTKELSDANQRLWREIAQRVLAAVRFEALLKAARPLSQRFRPCASTFLVEGATRRRTPTRRLRR